MIRLSLIILLVASAASAGVYKWVDSQGQTQFSDRPQPNAETVDIKPAPTAAVTDPPKAGQTQAAQLGPYAQFEIISPEANQTLRQPQDELGISLIVDPPLMQGHRLEIVLDGATITVEKPAGMQVKLTGVPFGSHTAQARMLDHQGSIVARTPAVSFHLRKPIPPGVLQ